MENIIEYKGDDDSYTLNFTDADNNDEPLDITGYTIFFTVKNNLNDADEIALIGPKEIIEHSDPTNGKSLLTLTSAETEALSAGKYACDFRMKDTNGKITTLGVGNFQINKNATRDVS